MTPAIDKHALRVARRRLRAALPGHKAAHIAEATAAALGHRTNAALVATIDAAAPISPMPEAAAIFGRRLAALSGSPATGAEAAFGTALRGLQATSEAALPAPQQLVPEDRELLYRLLARMVRSGVSLPDALRVMHHDVSGEPDGTALAACLGTCIALMQIRPDAFGTVVSAWVPELDRTVIEASERAGCLDRGLLALEALPRHLVASEADARTLLLHAVTMLVRVGVQMPDLLHTIATMRWQEAGEMADYIRHVAKELGKGIEHGENIGTAMRGTFPFSERIAFSVSARLDNFDESILQETRRRDTQAGQQARHW